MNASDDPTWELLAGAAQPQAVGNTAGTLAENVGIDEFSRSSPATSCRRAVDIGEAQFQAPSYSQPREAEHL